ncbi:Uncharacterized protein TCM_028517 [Theobroma cacao]|uniref:Uncharacterized protein n=1 Tax=Theobroma cacao TaxID=3641 RepID=A0A061GB48_THECC|nr:Uncharacterized protein TCM_028517 [Theobroma cacao]
MKAQSQFPITDNEQNDRETVNLNKRVYQKDEVSFNSQFDHSSIDLDNNTILLTSEYEEDNMVVDVEHNEEDDKAEGVKDEIEEESDEQDENDTDDDEYEKKENELPYSDDE